MIKWFLRDNILFLLAIGVAIWAVVWLNMLAPYSCDDWYWGSEDFSVATITELNGRYLGTIFAMIISRVKGLRIFLCSAIIILFIIVLASAGRGNRLFFFLASAAAFFMMPLSMFSQSVIWASGFANYIPSALIVVEYLLIVRREFSEDKAPSYDGCMPVVMILLGICGALFVETITLGNIILAAAVAIYHYKRFHTHELALIGFLLGAVIGAALMFLNSVYFGVFGGDDPVGYRVINFETAGSVYFDEFHYYFCYNNFPLNLAITAVFTLLAVMRFKDMPIAKRTIVAICFAVQFIFLVESGTTYFGSSIIPVYEVKRRISGILTFAFCVSAFVDVIILFKRIQFRTYCIFLMCAAVIYTAPMLVLTPISSRCFTVAYFLFVLLFIAMLGETLNGMTPKGRKIAQQAFGLIFFMAAVISIAIYLVQYWGIDLDNTRRETIIAEALASGEKEISLSHLASDYMIGNKEILYVYMPNPISDYLMNIFKAFYHIPDDVVVTVVGGA